MTPPRKRWCRPRPPPAAPRPRTTPQRGGGIITDPGRPPGPSRRPRFGSGCLATTKLRNPSPANPDRGSKGLPKLTWFNPNDEKSPNATTFCGPGRPGRRCGLGGLGKNLGRTRCRRRTALSSGGAVAPNGQLSTLEAPVGHRPPATRFARCSGANTAHRNEPRESLAPC